MASAWDWTLRRGPVLLLLAMAVALANPETGIPAWIRLEGDRRETERRIGELRSSLARIDREIVALHGDDFELERVIRTDLKLALPGEVIVIVDPEESGALSLP